MTFNQSQSTTGSLLDYLMERTVCEVVFLDTTSYKKSSRDVLEILFIAGKKEMNFAFLVWLLWERNHRLNAVARGNLRTVRNSSAVRPNC